MLAEFFGLRTTPFRSVPHLEPHFESLALSEAIARFRQSRDRGHEFFLLFGPPGVGKSTTIDAMVHALEPHARVAVVRHATLDASELLEEVCRRFSLGAAEWDSRPSILGRLERELAPVDSVGAAGRAVLVVDEAQLLSVAALEELRLLSNLTHAGRRLLHISLIGQPELLENLSRSELLSLQQRIGASYGMSGLTARETLEYIEGRLRSAGCARPEDLFSKAAAHAVFLRSSGLPREINSWAERAMTVAYVRDSPRVEVEHVAAAELDGRLCRALVGRDEEGANGVGTVWAAEEPFVSRSGDAHETPAAVSEPLQGELVPGMGSGSAEGRSLDRPGDAGEARVLDLDVHVDRYRFGSLDIAAEEGGRSSARGPSGTFRVLVVLLALAAVVLLGLVLYVNDDLAALLRRDDPRQGSTSHPTSDASAGAERGALHD